MSGTKRSREHLEGAQPFPEQESVDDESSKHHGDPTSKRIKSTPSHHVNPRFVPMFEAFRDVLDEHHSRKERIIKASRDITALSKKIIFALQRLPALGQPVPAHLQRDIDAHTDKIRALAVTLAPDVQGRHRQRYRHQLRCMEEFVEAETFAHYLTHQTIPGPAEVMAVIPEMKAVGLDEPTEYLLGLFDLFGEVMRYATVTATRTGSLSHAAPPPLATPEERSESIAAPPPPPQRSMLEDIHELSSCFEILLPYLPSAKHHNEYRSKFEAMRTSVRKVEALAYGLTLRQRERPQGWLPDLDDPVDA